MKNNKGISIIIPCYNSGSFLLDNVNSIVSQKIKTAFEIIIVDDGSNDKKTKMVLGSVRKIKNTIVAERDKNLGVQLSRNEGLKKARFKYILMIDADDQLNNDKDILKSGNYIDRAIEILENSPETVFVHSVTHMFGGYHGPTISAYPLKEELVLKKHHVPATIIYRKEDAVNSGMYDEFIKKWQDWSFGVSLLNYRFKNNKGNQIAFLDEPYCLYRIHNKTKRISNRLIDELKMIQITFQKNKDIFINYYKNVPEDKIPENILFNKPSKLKDMLYIASNNLERAIFMVSSRESKMISDNEIDNIP